MPTKKDTYDKEYKRLNYDTILFRVKKGKREEYQQAAKDFGLGQAEMFRQAIEQFIAERSLQDFSLVKPAQIYRQPPIEKISAEERRLLDEFDKLPPDIQKSVIKMIQSIPNSTADKIFAGRQVGRKFYNKIEMVSVPFNVSHFSFR